jgi:hypothetical protein
VIAPTAVIAARAFQVAASRPDGPGRHAAALVYEGCTRSRTADGAREIIRSDDSDPDIRAAAEALLGELLDADAEAERAAALAGPVVDWSETGWPAPSGRVRECMDGPCPDVAAWQISDSNGNGDRRPVAWHCDAHVGGVYKAAYAISQGEHP